MGQIKRHVHPTADPDGGMKEAIRAAIDAGHTKEEVLVVLRKAIERKRWRAAEKAMSIAHWSRLFDELLGELGAKP